jgi:hypothetical protein
MTIDWAETGGPPVVKPTRRGFGSDLIERGLARQFGGTAILDFNTAGVRCHIACMLPQRGDGIPWHRRAGHHAEGCFRREHARDVARSLAGTAVLTINSAVNNPGLLAQYRGVRVPTAPVYGFTLPRVV